MSQTRLSLRLQEIRTAWKAADRAELLRVAQQKGYLPTHVTIVEQDPLPYGLRPSYLRVLRLINAGRSYAEISAKLRVSPETLRTYASELYAHFGVATLPELVRAARAAGVVEDLSLRGEGKDRALQPRLSKRQLEALEHARLDRGPTEIAHLWKTTVSNADEALREARSKLDAASTAEAVSKAIQSGLLDGLPDSTRPPFSSRQREVLSLFARGYSRGEIGEELGMTRLCVGTYIAEMRAKVRARDDDELLSIAVKLNLVKRDRSRVARVRMNEVALRGAIWLTPRQHEVAEAIARWRSLPYHEIASRLGISLGTVNAHVRVLKHRLNLARTSREEFARVWRGLRKVKPRDLRRK